MSTIIRKRIKVQDLRDNFRDLKTGRIRRVQRKGLEQGSIFLRDKMRENCPVGAGAMTGSGERKKLRLLKKSLGWKTKTFVSTGVIVAIVGVRKGFKTVIDGKPYDPNKYAHIVENGRGPVRPKEKAVLADMVYVGGKWVGVVFGKYVPGVAPNPFMRAAFDDNTAQLTDIISRASAAELFRGSS